MAKKDSPFSIENGLSGSKILTRLSLMGIALLALSLRQLAFCFRLRFSFNRLIQILFRIMMRELEIHFLAQLASQRDRDFLLADLLLSHGAADGIAQLGEADEGLAETGLDALDLHQGSFEGRLGFLLLRNG